MKDIRESLRKLENQGEDYIWRTAKAAGEEIDRLRTELSALRESASKEAKPEGINTAQQTIDAIADAIDEMAKQLKNRQAAVWTKDIAAFVRACKEEQTPIVRSSQTEAG